MTGCEIGDRERALNSLSEARAETIRGLTLEIRAQRGKAEFFAELLRCLGVDDPWSLWVEHLASDEDARKRWTPETKTA